MKKVIYALIAVVLFVLGKTLLQSDYLAFLQWWVSLLYLGIIFMPLTILIFQKFHDRGYLFSKTIGIAVTGYLMWLFSSVRIMKFTVVSCILCVVISIAVNALILWFIYRNNKNGQKVGQHSVIESLSWNKILDSILSEELFFFAVFLIFTYIRGFKPDVYGEGGTEKFMDYGFITSMLRSEYMPPQDFWFSGTNLNYYYIGQYLAAFLTKLTGVSVTVAYNLMLMMVGTFAFVLPYSLVYNITQHFMKEKEKKGRLLPVINGAIAGIAVCIAGNMHYPTYQWLEPLVRKFFGMEASTDNYWFPDATRFIGYHPETTDKTIHEFPAYSFVLGDLHAHVINVMFVLTVLAVLFAWSLTRRSVKERPVPLWKEVLNPAIIVVAFYIGLFHTTNFWDFPIYYVVSGAVILFTNLIVYNSKGKQVVLVTVVQGAFVMAFAKLIAWPFTHSFDQIASNINLAINHTPLNQLIILWGLPIFMVIAFLCFLISDFCKNRNAELNMEQRKQSPIFQHLFYSVTGSDLFVIIIGLCAIGLILIPEVIFVQDIYSGDYKRANTMFKLTYQAFIMFGICFGYIFIRLICFGTTRRQKKVAITGMLLFALSVCYIQNAVNAWYGNIFDASGYEGIDATVNLSENMPDDALAIAWLNENITGTPVVLEAPGDSYTNYERVSVMTGLPTVLGWRTHEWLWKGDTSLLDARAEDIMLIYTSDDEAEVKKLLVKYKVSYIYVGKLEQDKYTDVNHDLLKSLGETVFSNAADETKEYETYIIKVEY